MVQLDRLLTWSNPIERKSDPYKKRSPTVVRIVERRSKIRKTKNTLFLSESPNMFLENCISCMGFNTKSSNCRKILIVIHWIFRKLSYLCPRIKVFFVYCKIQKLAVVRSFPYCYLYDIGKRPTS